MTEPIKIDGLAQFTRDLKKLDGDLPKAVRVALNQAAQVVVDYAKPKIPRRTGRAAASLRPQSTRTAVRVTAGGKKVPYYGFLDFGGAVGRGGSVKRPFLKDGRYLYKGYFAKRDSGEFQQVLSKALLAVVASAGIEVD